MNDQTFKSGDLVFLTKAFDDYFHKKNPSSKISLINRLAKIEEIIDWNSEKGIKIKEARIVSGKWSNLNLEDSKYILSIFYHDLAGRKGQLGVAERGVPMFQSHPETGEQFFVKVPDWVFKEIQKKCESFDVQPKSPSKEAK